MLDVLFFGGGKDGEMWKKTSRKQEGRNDKCMNVARENTNLRFIVDTLFRNVLLTRQRERSCQIMNRLPRKDVTPKPMMGFRTTNFLFYADHAKKFWLWSPWHSNCSKEGIRALNTCHLPNSNFKLPQHFVKLVSMDAEYSRSNQPFWGLIRLPQKQHPLVKAFQKYLRRFRHQDWLFMREISLKQTTNHERARYAEEINSSGLEKNGVMLTWFVKSLKTSKRLD